MTFPTEYPSVGAQTYLQSNEWDFKFDLIRMHASDDIITARAYARMLSLAVEILKLIIARVLRAVFTLIIAVGIVCARCDMYHVQHVAQCSADTHLAGPSRLQWMKFIYLVEHNLQIDWEKQVDKLPNTATQ